MFTDFRPQIAAAYRDAVDQSPKLTPGSTQPLVIGWEELARDSVERAAGVRLLLDVKETDDPEPYANATQMIEGIANGIFTVSRGHSEHPLWSVEENVAFRIVHDVLGHYAASIAKGWNPKWGAVNPSSNLSAKNVAGFDWPGENAACAAHVRLLPTGHPARTALFTECIGQAAFSISYGFDDLEQKVVTLIPVLERLALLGDIPTTILAQLDAWRRV